MLVAEPVWTVIPDVSELTDLEEGAANDAEKTIFVAEGHKGWLVLGDAE